MTSIGGFLPLETAAAAPTTPYHAGAAALSSGRACWHAILRARRPRRVLLPFYVCDAVLRPLAATATPYELYAIDESFRPALRRSPDAGELLLVVNYFGAMNGFVEALSTGERDRIVVDDTQAFFRRGRPDHWSFNSARKFFGVPDGGFLYGPATTVDDLPPSDMADCDHLLARLAGDDGGALERFREREARIGIEPRAISTVTAQLLGTIDMHRVRERRRANFEALHQELRPLNGIGIPLAGVACHAPMCYPFLPSTDVDRAELSRRGVFVATLWPEIESRRESGFERERLVARRLLPLPIDHRYEPDDMRTLARTLLQVLR